MTDIERMERLVALAIEWLEDSQSFQYGRFIPNNEECNKVAKGRTGACAMRLLKTIAGVK